MSNILDYTNAEDMKELEGQDIVLVGGCFDILHRGHIEFLKNAQKEADVLVVALESDEFIRTRKKKEPVHTQLQRAEILAAIRHVDYVVQLPYLKTHEEYFELVKRIKPHIIAVTHGDRLLDKKKDQAAQIGAVVKEVSPHHGGFSSSNIVSYETVFSD